MKVVPVIMMVVLDTTAVALRHLLIAILRAGIGTVITVASLLAASLLEFWVESLVVLWRAVTAPAMSNHHRLRRAAGSKTGRSAMPMMAAGTWKAFASANKIDRF